MAKRGRPSANTEVDSIIDTESEAWNIAKGFTTMKILKQMINLDRYENIAQYGSDEMDDPTDYYPDIAERRAKGLRRFLTTLRQLLGNCLFAIKKGDRPIISDYLKKIDSIENVLDGIGYYEENGITHEKEFRINEDHFGVCFRILRKMKDDVNMQLNRAGLIFRESDEIDLDKIMMDIVEGG